MFDSPNERRDRSTHKLLEKLQVCYFLTSGGGGGSDGAITSGGSGRASGKGGGTVGRSGSGGLRATTSGRGGNGRTITFSTSGTAGSVTFRDLRHLPRGSEPLGKPTASVEASKCEC